MELLNATSGRAGWTLGIDKTGRENVVVVVKQAYRLPQAGGEPEPLKATAPLVYADTFEGEPGFSAPIFEADFSPRKPFCDVLVKGSAVAKDGRPTSEMVVGLSVGRVQKSFTVIGNRVWRNSSTGLLPSAPELFVTQRISYGVAFGGVDPSSKDKEQKVALAENPVGCGFAPDAAAKELEGLPLPNTEELGRPFRSARSRHAPKAFGPIGRGWSPRRERAGTYDDEWLEKHFPFLPPDFDDAYFQASPPDQQTNHLRGGEEVTLVGLTTDGRRSFHLPDLEMPIQFFPKGKPRIDAKMAADTLLVEPEKERFTVVWRASHPLGRNIFEMPQALVGQMPRAWQRARETGKTYIGAPDRFGRGDREPWTEKDA